MIKLVKELPTGSTSIAIKDASEGVKIFKSNKTLVFEIYKLPKDE